MTNPADLRVQRYKCWGGSPQMGPSTNGEFVRFYDYAALLDELDALKAERDEIDVERARQAARVFAERVAKESAEAALARVRGCLRWGIRHDGEEMNTVGGEYMHADDVLAAAAMDSAKER